MGAMEKERCDMIEELRSLKQKRRNNEITLKEYYHSLLNMLHKLTDTLLKEDISENDIKKQIPLMLTFMEDQLEKLGER